MHSSRQWFLRQSRDPFVKAAAADAYVSRAAYKLIQIDDKHRILRGASLVVDLGAAPGGWSQVAAQRIRGAPHRPAGGASGSAAPRVIAIDLVAMEGNLGSSRIHSLVGDFTSPTDCDRIRQAIGADGRVNVVLSYVACPFACREGRRCSHGA